MSALQKADWNTTVKREAVVEESEALKAQAGRDLVLGGADLAAAFRRHDVIDDHHVYRNGRNGTTGDRARGRRDARTRHQDGAEPRGVDTPPGRGSGTCSP
ncbi:hypothetical protein ACGFW5_28425 [Streptomyces sp. NPDC048416]|uniref:hypothetical protein n=1 Tax=Streptomyces sp. NPDC048416 TaxID=3365546 RepID=UPI003716C8C7